MVLIFKKEKERKVAQITTRCHSLSVFVNRYLSLSLVVPVVANRCHSLYHSLSYLSLDVPLVCLFTNDRIFGMFVNEEVRVIVLIISSSTGYEFSAAFIFKALM